MTAASAPTGFDAVFGSHRGDGLGIVDVTAEKFEADSVYVYALVTKDDGRWEDGVAYPCPAPGARVILEEDPDRPTSPFDEMAPEQLEMLDQRTGGLRKLVGTVRKVTDRRLCRHTGQADIFWAATEHSYVTVEFTDRAGHPFVLTLFPPLFANWKPIDDTVELYEGSLREMPDLLEPGAAVYLLPRASRFETTFPQVTLPVTDELVEAVLAFGDEDSGDAADSLRSARAVYGDDHHIGLNLEVCLDRALMHVVRARTDGRRHLVAEPECRIRCIISTTEVDDDGYTTILPARLLGLEQLDWEGEPGGLLPTWLHENFLYDD